MARTMRRGDAAAMSAFARSATVADEDRGGGDEICPSKPAAGSMVDAMLA